MCCEDTENLTQKVREALKKEPSKTEQSTQKTESAQSSNAEQNSNTKESVDESVKKRDKV